MDKIRWSSGPRHRVDDRHERRQRRGRSVRRRRPASLRRLDPPRSGGELAFRRPRSRAGHHRRRTCRPHRPCQDRRPVVRAAGRRGVRRRDRTVPRRPSHSRREAARELAALADAGDACSARRGRHRDAAGAARAPLRARAPPALAFWLPRRGDRNDADTARQALSRRTSRGATCVPTCRAPPWRYTGAELDLVSLAEGGRYPVYGKSSVTANVAFWPAAATIIGNREVLERLTAGDRRTLAHAAQESLGASVAQLQAEDRSAVQTVCQRDRVAFVQASPADVSALRAAVRPVYARLERDPLTRSLLQRIQAMKRDAPPDPQLGCATPPQADEVSTPARRHVGDERVARSSGRSGRRRLPDGAPPGTGVDLVHESGFERLARKRFLQSPRGEDLVPVRRRQLCRLHVERVS